MATLIIQFVAQPKTQERTVRLMEGLTHVHITVNGNAMCRRRSFGWHPLKETRRSVATCPGCIVQATKAVTRGD